jgi:phosphoglycolate phosphatase-like HAD superfamily hydrolase
LVFDLDGTITDSIEACIVAVQRAYELAELGPPSRERLVPTIGLPLATSLPPLLRSESL